MQKDAFLELPLSDYKQQLLGNTYAIIPSLGGSTPKKENTNNTIPNLFSEGVLWP